MPGTILGQVTASTLRLDAEGRIVLWSDTARDMFGRAAAAAVHTLDLVAERSDGSTFPIECSLWCAHAALLTPGGPVSQCAP